MLSIIIDKLECSVLPWKQTLAVRSSKLKSRDFPSFIKMNKSGRTVLQSIASQTWIIWYSWGMPYTKHYRLDVNVRSIQLNQKQINMWLYCKFISQHLRGRQWIKLLPRCYPSGPMVSCWFRLVVCHPGSPGYIEISSPENGKNIENHYLLINEQHYLSTNSNFLPSQLLWASVVQVYTFRYFHMDIKIHVDDEL